MAILSRYRTLSSFYFKINENNRYTLLYSGHPFYILSVTVRRKSLILLLMASMASMASPFWRVGGVKGQKGQKRVKWRNDTNRIKIKIKSPENAKRQTPSTPSCNAHLTAVKIKIGCYIYIL